MKTNEEKVKAIIENAVKCAADITKALAEGKEIMIPFIIKHSKYKNLLIVAQPLDQDLERGGEALNISDVKPIIFKNNT